MTATGFNEVIVVDNGFSVVGHHLAVSDAIRNGCRARGIPCRFVVQHGAYPTYYTLPADIHPLFLPDVGFNPENELEALVTEGVRHYQFFQDLKNYVQPGPRDVVILHTIANNNLLGLYYWLLSLPTLPARVCLILRFGYNIYSTAVFPWVDTLYAHGLRLLSRLQPHVRFYADSPQLVRLYQEIAGIQARLVPLSIDFSPVGTEPLPPRAVKKQSTVLYLGDGRDEKGFSLLPEAIRRVLAVTDEVEFDIHVSTYQPQWVMDELLAFPNGVKVTKGVILSGPAYFEKFLTVDATLVAYYPIHYTYRTSHILAESLGMGCPVITTGQNSWMATFLATFDPQPGVILAEFSAAALAEAILEFHHHKEHYQRVAETVATPIRQEQNIDRFMPIILDD